MHDESPAGLAIKDRALAYWTDKARWGDAEEDAFWAVIDNG